MSKVTYYLRDNDDNRVVAKIDLDMKTSNQYCLSGNCYNATAWLCSDNENFEIHEWEFVAGVYCKWDACTHWYFYGEDYNPESEDSDKDSYYHLCGAHRFAEHILGMCFVWRVAELWMCENRPANGCEYTREVYQEAGVKELVDRILEGYSIERVDE